MEMTERTLPVRTKAAAERDISRVNRGLMRKNAYFYGRESV